MEYGIVHPSALFDSYQTMALATAGDLDRAILGLGLTGEAGEVADLIKKELGHKHPENPDKIKDELGDVLWYLAMLAQSYGFQLSEIARANGTKLAARYPEGFSAERSLNRGG